MIIITNDLIYYLLAVILVSFITNFYINRFYKISNIKLVIFSILSIIIGVLSTNVMSWIESGSFEGTSFFGAIFLMPIYVVLYSILFKIDFSKLFNLTAFLGMITSAVLKVKCFQHGCCGGRKIPIVTEYGYAVFPSQLAEMFLAILIFVTLLILFHKNKERKDLYPIMMLIYGIGRLNLNTFRIYEPIFLFMAWGHVWSIVSITIGIIWLVSIKRKKKQN